MMRAAAKLAEIKKSLLLILCTVLLALLPAACTPKPEVVSALGPVSKPYELANTRVHELRAVNLRRDYQVLVDVPSSYEESEKRFPIVFTTDANYSFPLIRSIRNRVGAGGQNIEDFILVSISYAHGDRPGVGRSRDYTPSNPLIDSNRDKSLYSGSEYGQAEGFRNFIEADVLPLITREYRVDIARKTYVGHSYGGLFGAYLLLTKPGMFDSYLLGSPSLWFDNHAISGISRAEQSKATKTPRVAIYAGSFETIRPEPRYFKKTDIVKDAQAFTNRLKTMGIDAHYETIQDEDHLTVFPVMVTRGLLWALPGRGPYTSG